MDSTYALIWIWCLMAGVLVGSFAAWHLRGWRDRRRYLAWAKATAAERRVAEEKAQRAEERRVIAKQRQLHDAGRKMPAREGAGAPIKLRKVKLSRSSRPQ